MAYNWIKTVFNLEFEKKEYVQALGEFSTGQML
jgi:hypothetical protein